MEICLNLVLKTASRAVVVVIVQEDSYGSRRCKIQILVSWSPLQPHCFEINEVIIRHLPVAAAVVLEYDPQVDWQRGKT